MVQFSKFVTTLKPWYIKRVKKINSRSSDSLGSKKKIEDSSNIDKIIENKTKESNKSSECGETLYRVDKANCGSHRKAFIVGYMFTYDEIKEGSTFHKVGFEKDCWSADTVEQAILYTYKTFGNSYEFNQKYGDKKNLTFLRIYDVYVKLHDSYIPECYSNSDSIWNNDFRNKK